MTRERSAVTRTCRGPAHERGAVSIVTTVAALTLCLSAAGAADVGAMLVARARAQAAADAAALAAVVEQVPVLSAGVDPEAAARAVAERNGAELERCDCVVGSPTASVVVTVVARARWIAAWAGRLVRARATASADDDLMSYRREAG